MRGCFLVLAALLFLLAAPAFPCSTPANDSVYSVNSTTEPLCAGYYLKVRFLMSTNNATLDCAGATLDGDNQSLGYKAVDVNGKHNTTVKGCFVTRYQHGYYASFTDYTNGDTVFNNTFFNNTNGIENLNNDRLNMTANRFIQNGYGIVMYSAYYYTIDGNIFANNTGNAIDMDSFGSIRYASIIRNNFTNNVSAASVIYVPAQLAHSNISYNIFNYSLSSAITFGGSLTTSNTSVSHNQMHSINDSAIELFSIRDSNITHNLVNGSYYNGLYFSCSGCADLVEWNNLSGNGSSGGGIYAVTMNGTVIRHNKVTGYQYPFYFGSSVAYTQVYDNYLNKTSSNPINGNDTNSFNTTLDCGSTNLMGGPCVGGNYWSNSTGGYGGSCADANSNGICDSDYSISGITDYLPLAAYAANSPPAYSAQSQNSSSVQAGEAVKLEALWTDDAGLSLAILSTNESGSWSNRTPAALSSNWSNFTWQNSSFAGTLGWRIWANDSSGSWNSTAVMALAATDSEPPKSFSPAANVSTPAPGDSVKFSAYWTDNVALSAAVLSTNESGSWSNRTPSTPASGWSNISWSNISFSGLLGWRIWANDTSGNWNATAPAALNFSDYTPPTIVSANFSPSEYSALALVQPNESANASVNYGTTAALGQVSGSSSLSTSHNITLANLSVNTTYYANVTCCDAAGNCATNGTFSFTTLPITINISWDDWDGNTTNFTNYNATQLSNLSNVTLANPSGRILFNIPLNLTTSRNLTGLVNVSQNSIFLNSSAIPEFNASANLTFANITLTLPIVKRDGADCGAACSNASFNITAKQYNVTVSSFSAYLLIGQCEDAVQNFGETGVDCGGSCPACATTTTTASGGGGSSGYYPSTTTTILTYNGTSTTTSASGQVSYSPSTTTSRLPSSELYIPPHTSTTAAGFASSSAAGLAIPFPLIIAGFAVLATIPLALFILRHPPEQQVDSAPEIQVLKAEVRGVQPASQWKVYSGISPPPSKPPNY